MGAICIFANDKFRNGCSILNETAKCEPKKCMWRHTEETYFQSLEQAMKNYHKATGRTDYMATQKALPDELKKRFAVYLAKKGEQRELYADR